ncbi:YdiU family protein [Persicimonas caeni]|uniref:Protein nucleotidyltransferase YdiU n=1 Tax=Persicimonas caeni TaxID=2292766 RepID=A0A4Y6Q205_PERCE|nr:YdiU family protein [Persicimonas caeni]QDG54207.1 YdiU family protein [Persicimonas caeni]QED35428.1 YdiU family protein [Persicimonas caeni]
MKVRFDNSYLALPERFYSRVSPEPVASPEVVRVNTSLAEQLGFDPDWLDSPEGAEFAVGNRVLDGSEPIATVYGGHQFGNWAGRLGDGRALLLGEVIDRDGQRFDVQLKGSGRTPYSRRGDGRAPLGPVLREYLVSEAMAALGIPTTRSLVAATTGESVRRETILPGGVLVRVAKSHIRIGTFEWFASRGDTDAVELLAEHVVARHYPKLEGGSVVDLLRAVAERQARLVAQWMLVGFIHGVMNTDNMLLSGETIDYGPCAFMNAYDPSTVFSSIDRHGRYAYGNQPKIAQWNLSRLAQALLASTERDEAIVSQAQDVVDAFPQMFQDAWAAGMAQKLGLSEVREEDWALFTDLLELMYVDESDYTLTFVRLTELVEPRFDSELSALPDAFGPWVERWQARRDDDAATLPEQAELMVRANPVFIPRNHLVEEALDAAVGEGDFSRFHQLVEVLADPYAYDASHSEFALPPGPDEQVHVTFCGT